MEQNNPDDVAKVLEVVEQNQEFDVEREVDALPYQKGDLVVHTPMYVRSILRGNAKKQAEEAIWEVIGCTKRSATVIVPGSAKPYGSQYPHRYLMKASPEAAERVRKQLEGKNP